MGVAISIENVTKKYGDKTVIDGLSLDINEGEFFTLLGPSGCGKTTLLRMIIGFNSIEDGQIKVNNQIINNIPVNKRNMGMVFQNYAIFPHMSVKDNVAFGLKKKNLTKQEMEAKIDEILKVVKIEEFKNRMPDQLSGGQQQRVALARAIVTYPQVLLMDEPLSNLDAKLRVEMRNAIKDIQQQIGITTVYVTHDQEEALAVSDRIAVMDKGVIQQIGTPREIYGRPKNAFVSSFIGTTNILKAKIRKKSEGVYLDFGDEYNQEVTILKEDVEDRKEVIVSVRPQDFIISEEGNGIDGVIKGSIFLGINTHYFIELLDGSIIEAIENTNTFGIIQNNTKVKLNIKPSKINIFNEEGTKSLIKEGEVNERT
ncbi:ABC transporter ATP-binding protein [Clostridium malenominatum]|uniref:ABC transporter ATP-binding protein n=1 Tax=Clostridium malenominatum TaxID=1539 RepID=A0ABN1J0W1_9CLOT